MPQLPGVRSPRHPWRIRGLCAVVLVQCACSNPSAPSTSTTSQVIVEGPATLTQVGQTVQYKAILRLGDGSTQDQTSTAAWSSTDTMVLSAAAGGLVTTIGGGSAVIRATVSGVVGLQRVDMLPGTPIAGPEISGVIGNPQTVADLIEFHQDAPGGAAFRSLGVITRWELPIPIFVDAGVNRDNVERALNLWKGLTGISYVYTSADAESRILIRAGTDGLGSATGRGGIDGTYPNNQARSGFVVFRPDAANCDYSLLGCANLFQHEIAHAIGMFGHVAGGGVMSGGFTVSLRELNLLTNLYRLPHGTRIESDGAWRVVR